MAKRRSVRTEQAIPFNYLDLFCGCGGFSLGLEAAGLNCVAAIDFDPDAISAFKSNFPGVGHVLERDLTKFTPEALREIIGQAKVDIIVGGPPCQGFSKARMVDGSNHGSRLVEDPRRLLFRNYLHYVEFFRPSIFVMENVPGIRTAAGGEFFIAVQAEARKLGYRVHATPVRAWHYGIPQKRERQLIIGTTCDLPIFSAEQYVAATHGDSTDSDGARKGPGRPRGLKKLVTLWDAIGDLPILGAGEGEDSSPYDFRRRHLHVQRYGRNYLEDVAQVDRAVELTGHVARSHSARDLRDFDRLHEGETSLQAIERGVEMEFPYDRENFKDRYTKQHRNRLCSTIVAHLSKDGLMFIHPTQRRSLTVREAARIQSFPDWFTFPKARTVAYRLIGNAVPPLLGKAIGRGLKRYLGTPLSDRELSPLPTTPKQAAEWLTAIVEGTGNGQRLRTLPLDDFKKAWFSIGFLNSWLHPDSASQNGGRVDEDVHQPAMLADLVPEIAAPIYASSGWPVRLIPIAREATRRFQQGKLRFDEYYCSHAQLMGWTWWKKQQGETWQEGQKGTS
ncbi:DNA cytosine methyltransferase [Rhodanobacter glycinis]|uniref:DNA cytosine methyltransferase n=1 Tax=Rhodanobacter glycinis TaxID=582702 RepID=UPI001C318951|nr:DNA cytosine methyltransferase [Rhodanobacter glycinis]